MKTQVAGPWTLAAGVELRSGNRVLTDAGAVAEFVESLAEGLRGHVADLARRTRAEVVVQIDEPTLPAVLAGAPVHAERLRHGAARCPAPRRAPGWRRSSRRPGRRARSASSSTAATRRRRWPCSARPARTRWPSTSPRSTGRARSSTPSASCGTRPLELWLGLVPTTDPPAPVELGGARASGARPRRPSRLRPRAARRPRRPHARVRAGRGEPGLGADRDGAQRRARPGRRGPALGLVTSSSRRGLTVGPRGYPRRRDQRESRSSTAGPRRSAGRRPGAAQGTVRGPGRPPVPLLRARRADRHRRRVRRAVRRVAAPRGALPRRWSRRRARRSGSAAASPPTSSRSTTSSGCSAWTTRSSPRSCASGPLRVQRELAIGEDCTTCAS